MNQTPNTSSSESCIEDTQYTERDLAILVELLHLKYMTTFQITKLFWPTSITNFISALKACQRRLRILERRHVIRRIQQATLPTMGKKEDIFTLDVNSIPMLASRGINPKQVDLRRWVNEENNLQIKHILELTNVKIAWKQAAQTCGVAVDAWVTEKAIRLQYTNEAASFINQQGEVIRKPIADAFSIIRRDDKQGYFWFEVDRSNLTVGVSVHDRPTIAGKIQRFLAWEQSEAFRKEFGTRPLRKLFITRGLGRLHNMRSVTEQMITQLVEENDALADEQRPAEIQRLAKRFSFTTFDRFYTHNPLTDPIWCQVGSDIPQLLLS